MPEDFKCVWEKEVNMKLDVKTNSKKATENFLQYNIAFWIDIRD